MTWIDELNDFHARLADRLGPMTVPVLLVFWIVLWPLAFIALPVWLVRRHRSLDHSPAAKRERRVAHLLRWFPAQWRERYGDELGALLHDRMAEGRGGVRLWLDVARTGLSERVAAAGPTGVTAAVGWFLCWIPLIPQGVVPAIFKLTEASGRSWFLALYLPEALQWPVIAGMIVLGLGMLGAAVRASVARYGRPTPC